MKRKNSRAFAPLWTVVVGSVIAAAVAIGHTWAEALITEIVTLVFSVAYYVLTGRDSDVGAIYGQRSDERQQEVRARASRFGFIAAISAAYVCAIVSVARGQSYWQADVIGTVGGVAFLVGIAKYGVHIERPVSEYDGIMSGGARSDHVDATVDATELP